MAKKVSGVCALCGKRFDNLTFEHIPPKASFNASPVKPVSTMDMLKDGNRLPWDTTGVSFFNLQKGMGDYTLCEDCNNKTGAWYGSAYSDLAQVFHRFLSNPIDPGCTGVEIKDVYPLRFIKQVLSMFCSINRENVSGMNILRQFVLDKNATGIDRDRFMLRMYLTRSGTKRHIPIMGLGSFSSGSFEPILVSEITGYPFGFILYFNPKDVSKFEGLDITSFADYEYDIKATVAFPLCMKEVNELFPLSYRTKEEIQACIDENAKDCNEVPAEESKNGYTV